MESTDWQAGFMIMDVAEGEPRFEPYLWNGEFIHCRGRRYEAKKVTRKAA
jgi:hypothetical protein